jgi:hypothetical protein
MWLPPAEDVLPALRQAVAEVCSFGTSLGAERAA